MKSLTAKSAENVKTIKWALSYVGIRIDESQKIYRKAVNALEQLIREHALTSLSPPAPAMREALEEIVRREKERIEDENAKGEIADISCLIIAEEALSISSPPQPLENAEDRYCRNVENACPACGGSGHKDDVAVSQDRADGEFACLNKI